MAAQLFSHSIFTFDQHLLCRGLKPCKCTSGHARVRRKCPQIVLFCGASHKSHLRGSVWIGGSFSVYGVGWVSALSGERIPADALSGTVAISRATLVAASCQRRWGAHQTQRKNRRCSHASNRTVTCGGEQVRIRTGPKAARRRSHPHPIKLEIGLRSLGSVSCSAKGFYLLLTIQRLNCCRATSGVGYAGCGTGYPRARLSPVECEWPPRGRCRSALADCTARDLGFIFGYLRKRLGDAQHPEGREEDVIKEGASCIVGIRCSLSNLERPLLSQPSGGFFRPGCIGPLFRRISVNILWSSKIPGERRPWQ